LTALLLWCGSFSAAHTDGGAEAGEADATRIEHALRTQVQVIEGRRVRVTLANDEPHAVTVLTRDTPFDQHRLAPPLRIETLGADGQSTGWLHWHGRLAKRRPPGPDEMLELAPGRTLSVELALDEGWSIDRTGRYRIGLREGWQSAVASPSQLVSRSARRGERLELGFQRQPLPQPIEAILVRRAVPDQAQRRLRTPEYLQCSATQQREIFTAARVAERWVTDSVDALEALSDTQLQRSPRYRAWFGAYDAQRAADVLADLAAIGETIADRQVTFNCDCAQPGVYAYVYPTRAYDVWLCPAFWSAALEGTDSRAGTLVHELSHFRIVAGTSDHVYAHARAKALASTRPDLAIDNADSFEYFVENTPPIALRANDGAPVASSGSSGSADEESLNQGQTRRYTIEQGLTAMVESLSGDADLELYPGRDAEGLPPSCVSRQGPTVSRLDRCDLVGTGPWTAVVVAHTDTRYRFTVDGSTTFGPDRASDDDSGASAGGGGGAMAPLTALLVLLLTGLRACVPGWAGGGGSGWALRGRHGASMLLLGAIAGAGCTGAATSLAAPVAASATLQMTLLPTRPAGTSVRVTVSNRSSIAIRMLSWNTPFESQLSADVFAIMAAGERARYTGRLLKRAWPPPAEAWITLHPGEQRQVEWDLSRHYDLLDDGPWQVSLQASGIEALSADGASVSLGPADEPILLRR